MHHAKLSILLCEDMDEFSRTFKEQQDEYFNVEVCNDIHALCAIKSS